ncbi:MAG: hypothetical protein AB1782_02525 [Cyanobacteriota bacterium]
MLKLSKKVILFFMLVIKLAKQLVVGLTVFLYNRTLGSRWGAIICMGAVALLLLLGAFFFMPSESVANVNTNNVNSSEVTDTISSGVAVEEEFNFEENLSEEDVQTSEELLAQVSQDITGDVLGANIDGVNFQASAVGRSEPFAPIQFGGTGYVDIPGGDPDVGPAGLTPEEIKKQEEEQRRQEIMASIQGVTVKGIVYDADGGAPMAILEYAAPDGSTTVKTAIPGDVLYLSNCQPKIEKIDQNFVKFVADDVTEFRHLPPFEDDADDTVPVADISPSGGDLVPPPTPGNANNDSSIGDAKKKIEEIDKLLDSF